MRGVRGWYHCAAWTYGQWLRGDHRGFRTRHHREHCEGDYRRPPDPNQFEWLEAYSKRLMKRDKVDVSAFLRQLVVDAFVARLQEFDVDVVIASMGKRHLHVLATRQVKAHCSAVGFDLRLQLGEGLWGKRSHAEAITGRSHQLNVVRYIRDHARAGAAIWAARRK